MADADVLNLIAQGAGSTGPLIPSPGSGPDTQAPTIPTGLTATAVSSTQINLAWDASTDVPQTGRVTGGMSSYNIKRGGTTIATQSSTAGLALTLTAADIGSPATPGTGTPTGPDWAVVSYGTGITGTSDQFTFVYGSSTGDLTVICKVPVFTHATDSAKAGPMIRQSLDANAAFVHVCAFPAAQGKGFGLRSRATAGATASSDNTVASTTTPCWLKLVKSGNSFTGYYSTTGASWTSIGSVTVAMSGTVYGGGAVASNGSGSVSATLTQLAVNNLAALTYSDTGRTAATSYTYTIEAVDAASNTSAASVSASATTSSAGGGAGWPASTWNPNDLTQYGMTDASPVYIINDLSSSTSGSPTLIQSQTYTCTLGQFLALSSKRWGVFSVSGRADLQKNYYVYGDGVVLAGETAPSPGVAFKNGRLRGAGSNQIYRNYSNYCGNSPRPDGTDDLDNRDGAEIGNDPGNPIVSNVWFCNVSAYGCVDETFEMYSPSNNSGYYQCLAAFPLLDGKSAGEPHGATGIIGDLPTLAHHVRVLGTHSFMRTPALVRSPSANVLNCLAYNSGSLPWLIYNEWGRLDRQLGSAYGDTDLANLLNWESNLGVVGTNTYVDSYFLNIGHSGADLVTGSQAYLTGNFLVGFSCSSSPQSAMVLNETSWNPLVGSRITSIYPTGYVTETFTDTTADKLAFAALMRDTCGSRTKDRTAGADAWAAAQPYNWIMNVNGTPVTGGTTFQIYGNIIESMTELLPLYAAGGDANGFPTYATNTVDLFSSAAMQSDPLISVAAGRTAAWMAAWLDRWHLRVNNY
ncbi:MAG: hypothetical protein ABL964_10005 [Steroidobacteraceae bacterium]